MYTPSVQVYPLCKDRASAIIDPTSAPSREAAIVAVSAAGSVSRSTNRGGHVAAGQAGVRVLEQVRERHGRPKQITADNGPKFISKALDSWAYRNGVTFEFSRPGKPTDNAYVESFNGHFRKECLDQHWFASLEEARQWTAPL